MKLIDRLLCTVGLHRSERYVLGYYICVACQSIRTALETETEL